VTHQAHAAGLREIHGSLLAALRNREQEIFRYLTILGPALGSYAALFYFHIPADRPNLFLFGTISVLLSLLLEALYTLALGYNFRYVNLEIAKIENLLGIRDAMLLAWPKSRQDYLTRRWCVPPEIIQVFWYAFLCAILWVFATAAGYFLWNQDFCRAGLILLAGVLSLVAGILPSWCYFGRKLRSLAVREPEAWIELK
jgi:hypothetical protein